MHGSIPAFSAAGWGKTLVAAILVAGATTRTAGWSTPMPPPVLSVRDHGVVGGLEQLRVAGGGTLYVPKGVWLSPPLNLTSHLTLYLAAGAVLKADPTVFIEGRWPLIAPLPNYGCGHPDRSPPGPDHRWAPFLDGYDLTNLTIGGENGTIDGSGLFWWARHLAEVEVYTRPPLFSCVRCNDIVLEDATFKNSAFWCGRRAGSMCGRAGCWCRC